MATKRKIVEIVARKSMKIFIFELPEVVRRNDDKISKH